MDFGPPDEYRAQQIASQCMHNLRLSNLIRNMVSASACVCARFNTSETQLWTGYIS